MKPTYAELRSYTHYSFLRGASHPSELIARAVELELPAMGITDINGVYGLPKAYLEAKKHSSFKLIAGAEVRLKSLGAELPPLSLLAQNRKGYGLLCRLLTTAHAEKEKGEAYLELEQLLAQLTSTDNGLIAISHGSEKIQTLKEIFGKNLYLPLSRFLDHADRARTDSAKEFSKKYDVKIIATNEVAYHQRERRQLQDTLTCIREGCTLDQAGYRLFSNSERYLKSHQEMSQLFSDMPEALSRTLEIAESCNFSMSELKYRYPSEWIPAGETAQSHLDTLVWKGAAGRYHGLIPDDVRKQIEHELQLIQQLGYADYFLTIWEIVEFARSRKILCQGRGSGANSVVCYCLEITAIDPVRMNLLFERFISAERGEPPDIDVDFEHERREEVIQHIYEKYGRDRAGMVAAVVTYRSRSTIREISKVFGCEMDRRDYKNLEDTSEIKQRLDPLINELKGFPRHLSIHSGGFTLSADPMIEIVPIEPARMEGRTIVQWDKNDLDALGLIKVDILSLGMLSALRKTIDLVNYSRPSETPLTLATIPADDVETYKMIRRADTVGVFQIESRAQMSMLPRLLPENFYDLVIEIALVRPGPIQGKMVHPYLRRRRQLEPVDIPHPALEPILRKTLGVPLFQEQVMKIAIALAGFTPGESDELRRAIGAWRSSGSIDKIGMKLKTGLIASGLSEEYAERIFQQIQGFAEYGFPESHSASFAILAYASSWLKCHYPAEFCCALVNSQPMGFYASHTLIDDAKRHGARVLPLDPAISVWDCEMEDGAVRLGWRLVAGINENEVKRLLAERARKPWKGLLDFLSRSGLRRNILHKLALGDAFKCFEGYDQRHALWEILGQEIVINSDVNIKNSPQLSLFSGIEEKSAQKVFSEFDDYQAIVSDYTTYGVSHRGHPMKVLRQQFKKLRELTTTRARSLPSGQFTTAAGVLIVAQSPPTANETRFATLEDENGFLDLILHKAIFEKYAATILDHTLLIVKGVIQRDGESISMIAKDIQPFMIHSETPQTRPLLSEGIRNTHCSPHIAE